MHMNNFQSWIYFLGTSASALVGYYISAVDLGFGVLLLVLGVAIAPSFFWPHESRLRGSASARQNAEDVLHALSSKQIAGISASVV